TWRPIVRAAAPTVKRTGASAREELALDGREQLARRRGREHAGSREAVKPALVRAARDLPAAPRVDHVGAAEVAREVRTAAQHRAEAPTAGEQPQLQLVEAQLRMSRLQLLDRHDVRVCMLDGL